MQLAFLWDELQGYKSVISTLKGAKSVRAASDAVLLGFEKPADQSEAVQKKRAGYGERPVIVMGYVSPLTVLIISHIL